ncbi:UDP-N-acetylmuramoyl-L-alanyl-D-glutamate--2,6-diaminopimelate ligase [Alicyclobacillus mengziensis]|uniref:UDP-N-acetylmuramoyl-L-alanyl-D-glutamate--2,6-diaminopimelate ligase n=1 Tax=Alicyclobacillus mengziensis TaxID=2931921 RepID=A0A9X7W2I8_9BACL|nr:UDP-N-acetylmuramoyl-L-alanyl-D-glutamate--2,6-diaminopimelate ligase [Alicyclobacillus mengziensis]QSO49464.1 UDP-N-acetylmuramoyl-L-alanyl-D-glutamate--2,6-diaminopimelate ligase [Alicyclobacillus mengziensis]
MVKLSSLTRTLLRYRIVHDKDVNIVSITSDSRTVQPGSLFVALSGYTVDGHNYVLESVEKGAVAVLLERPNPQVRVPQIVVPDSHLASAIVADAFYGHPSDRLRMIGVTGTNGKTTVTHLIERVLADAGKVPGVCGTLGARFAGRAVELNNTTPFPVELHGILNDMALAGCTHGVMEVSSHALERRQNAGVQYKVAVFTNLTQDHLDFHGTMEAYLAAKGKLFSRLGNAYGGHRGDMSYGVLNADDAASTYLAAQTVVECVTYGIENDADVRAKGLHIGPDGLACDVHTWLGDGHLQMSLTGRFNAYNALAAIAVGLIEGIPLEQILESLRGIAGVPGRLERVAGNHPFTVLVDYSHTPDSLENALDTIHEFAKGRVICIVGCGGDRDKGKRPIMARIACEKSDLAVLTSDNPRTEDPEAILDDMEAGVKDANYAYQRILDRALAIESAISVAQPDDVVLIAGKGHETYQIIGRTKHHFDDREVAKQAINKRFNG